MRKSLNILLAAGLAASAFSGIAAQKAGAACANPDELPVIDLTGKDPYTETISYLGTPMVGLYTGPDFVIDLKDKKADVTFTISWSDGMSDYDLTIKDVAADAAIVVSEETDTTMETATGEIADCLVVEVGIFNFIGAPIADIDLTVELG